MARVVTPDGLVLVDSITEITLEDAGRIIISGSHGGRSSAGFAVALIARLYVFNDAGIGKDNAGVAGLALLAKSGRPACCVAADSARIGEARDTLESGIVSAANPQAAEMGLSVGKKLNDVIAALGNR